MPYWNIFHIKNSLKARCYAAFGRFFHEKNSLFALSMCFALALSGMVSSCSNNLITDPAQIVFPATNVSFGQHVQPLLNVSCNVRGCHGFDGSRQTTLRLTSYIEIMSSPGLVVAGRPESSVLVQVIRGILPHPPSFQASITANHRDGIAQWVREGARAN